MSTKRTFLCALAAVVGITASGFAFAQEAETSLARVQRTKVLRVGAVAGAIPYFSKDIVTKKWEGFGPDFSESLAKSLGAKVEYVETTWGNAVLDLQANRIDAMFGMAPTPARKEMVNFSDTLFENTYTAVCKKGVAPKTWEELNAPNMKIAVDVGSSHDQLASRILTKADVARLESSGAATMSLQSGRSDCQILVVLLAQPLLVKRASVGTMYIPQPMYTAPVSIGLRKETDTGMQTAVNTWLADFRAKDQVRGVILKNMENLAGVPASSFPAEIKF
ncbi:transporter substrate-binding domain-containing protein [Pigmentiphaga aceris]|uniref:Transporter substrate-binding domain-containing protein n=1 Tax=Pigmentiphaga aceris TaxID=1940612 RepID=A0A5C0B4N3_9BURK|nr:transporter substrate-binding domain-containing protein [Pigmentiphaga aceris]QEI08816.1 transporter substrate-binding domain-containing protein [Pigmentiphaga aceris]